jgi:predicted amidohydrolase
VPRAAPRDSFHGACVQFDVRQEDVARNLQAAEEGLRLASQRNARLAVLPEMWTTSFVRRFTPELIKASAGAEERIRQLSQELGMAIVGSAVEAFGSSVRNRAQVFDNGRCLGAYRKIHLFRLNGEDRIMAAGSEPFVVDSSVGRLAIAICYDLRFPELVRWFFHQEAELLAVPAQWPEARANHWRTLCAARAIENQMFVLGCNRLGVEPSLRRQSDALVFPGDSRIVDPVGELLVAGAGEAGPVIAEIEPRRVRTVRRTLPIARDRRPEVYQQLWSEAWRRLAQRRAPPLR